MIDYKFSLQKANRYVNDNTKEVAVFCTAASVVASIFFLYYLDRMGWLIGVIYLISLFVYHGILNSNYKTRKN